LAAASVCLPVLLGACSKTNDTATTDTAAPTTTATPAVNAGPTVSMTEFNFSPDPATVKVGQAVTWKNDGSAKHQVSADSAAGATKAFESDLIGAGGSYVFTPTTAGTFNYICRIHPEKMKGTLTVTAA
jgi:plastocyanin